MCACKETDVRESPNVSFSLAAKGRAVAEKRATLSSLKSPFPRYLNALYFIDYCCVTLCCDVFLCCVLCLSVWCYVM
jgi:hypothetical protein